MQITRLDEGKDAPLTADRVRITKISDGRFRWGGSVKLGNSAAFNEGQDEYSMQEHAESDAFAWAGHHNVAELFVEFATA